MYLDLFFLTLDIGENYQQKKDCPVGGSNS